VQQGEQRAAGPAGFTATGHRGFAANEHSGFAANEHSAHAAPATDQVAYDLIGEITARTRLTRRTVAAILRRVRPDTFAQYRQNPDQFIAECARLIGEQRDSLTAAIAPGSGRQVVDEVLRPAPAAAADAQHEVQQHRRQRQGE